MQFVWNEFDLIQIWTCAFVWPWRTLVWPDLKINSFASCRRTKDKTFIWEVFCGAGRIWWPADNLLKFFKVCSNSLDQHTQWKNKSSFQPTCCLFTFQTMCCLIYLSDHVSFLFTFQTHVLFVYISDHNPDRFAQDCSASSSGSSRPEDWPLFRIWRCRPCTTHGHFRAHCSLARMHLVILKLFYLTRGRFHELFCTLHRSFAPCPELLHQGLINQTIFAK